MRQQDLLHSMRGFVIPCSEFFLLLELLLIPKELCLCLLFNFEFVVICVRLCCLLGSAEDTQNLVHLKLCSTTCFV